MGSLFVPDHFVFEASSDTDIKIASIAWGFQLGFTVLTVSKAAAQTLKIWRRVHRVTAYVAMTWLEVVANFLIGVLFWLYMIGKIPPSFVYFMVVLTCWTFEVQCLIQIVRNRISLLIHNEREKFWLKWGSFGLVLLINISVFCIWIPARLQISPFWIHLNNIWDRIEKGLFLIIDGGLNMYFIVLVKRKLLSSGMTKYKPLFHFNIVMVAISLSLDVALIALMSMKNGLIYAQFHPVVYMIKLNIEMSMAALISKIARSADGSTPSGGDDTISIPMSKSTGRGKKSKGQSAGYRSDDGMETSKKRFDPTVSEIMANGDDHQRMYHAWVTTDGRRYSEATRDMRNGTERGRASAVQFAGDDDLEPQGRIRKETQVQVTVEGEREPKREPSEDGSTIQLKP